MVKHLLIVLSIAFQEQLAVIELCKNGYGAWPTLVYALAGSTVGYLVFWFFPEEVSGIICLLRKPIRPGSRVDQALSAPANRHHPWGFWWQTAVLGLVVHQVDGVRVIQLALVTLGLLGFWLYREEINIRRELIHQRIENNIAPTLAAFAIGCIPLPIFLQASVAATRLLKIKHGFWWILVASFIRTYLGVAGVYWVAQTWGGSGNCW
ncbi:MAG: hypothetical protein ABIB97_04150 [Patescibacteria group bacterium]